MGPCSPGPGHLSDQAADLVDHPWLFLVLLSSMMLVLWSSMMFFREPKARQLICLVTYTLVAIAIASENWESYFHKDGPAKTFFGVAAISGVLMAVLISSITCLYAAKVLRKRDTWSWRGMAVESAPVVRYPRGLPRDPKRSFLEMHEMLCQEILNDIIQDQEGIPEQLAWVEQMLKYNTLGGDMKRGMGVVDVLRAFASSKGKEMTYEEVPEVQEIAINDSFVLEAHVHKILKRHFEHEDYYIQLVELFHDVAYRTEMGQLLDLTTQPMAGPVDLSRFTLERYRMIVRNKTAFHTFYCPCAIGMIYAGVKDPASYQMARDICYRIGEFFQIRNDYLDCYGHPDATAKVGTDIQDAKCTWLVVQALERATAEQRELLKKSYGVDKREKVETVRKIYWELGLERLYKEHQEKVHVEINELIAKTRDIPHEVFHQFMHKT